MAVTKILARKGRLDIGINYVLNGDKTQERVLTAHLNCDPGRECRQMLDTKRAYSKEDGVMYYHIIQSFKPGEVTPEQALEIATEFAKEHLPGYETVIGVHVDRQHIHAHLVFNSVNADTGEKYHSNAQSYYQQIRATSDRLCREHGLSVIMEGAAAKAVSYIEWLRQSKGQPTFRTMLEADLRTAIQDANDLGHFFMLMEHKGWEISHGNRLGFRLRGQDRFMYPGRKNALFTEDGIRAAIQNGLEDIEAGRRPAVIYRPSFQPYKKHPKYTGFMALYVHYLYVLGKIGQWQYPPRMTPQLRQEVMKSERYREQFDFLRENDIATQGDMAAFQARTEDALANLMKQRTILNVRKKKRKKLYDALADVAALAPAKQLYEGGLSGMEAEYARYMEAVAVLEQCPIPRERLSNEKVEIYEQLAQINRQIRAERKKLALCREIQSRLPQMEHDIDKIEEREGEVKHDERICRHSQIDEAAPCHGLRISEVELERILYGMLLVRLQTLATSENCVSTSASEDVNQKIETCMEEKRKLYEQFVMQKINLENYKIQQAKLDSELEQFKQTLAIVNTQVAGQRDAADWASLLQRLQTENHLTVELEDALVDRVDINTGRVEPIWR